MTSVMSIQQLMEQARLLHEAGRLAEAEQAYRAVIVQDPRQVDALNNLGIILQAQQRFDEAMLFYRQAQALAPTVAAIYHNMGSTMQNQNRMAEAETYYLQALQQDPNIAQTHCNLGILEQGRGRLPEAETRYKTALALKPDYMVPLYNLGTIYKETGYLDDALNCFRQTLVLRPDFPEALNNVGSVLHVMGRLEEAQGYFNRALAIQPDHVESLNNLGSLYHHQGRLPEAVAMFRQALALDPANLRVYINLGVVLSEQGRPREAIDTFEQTLALAPDSPDAHCFKGFAHLLLGEFETGWQAYEWRLKVPAYVQRNHPDKFARQPYWDGGDLTGKTIVVYAEQGFGDTIQFARFLPGLRDKGAKKIIFQCQPGLKRLMANLDGYDELLALEAEQPPHDVQIPLMSLPHRLGTRLETIPAPVPYLHADPKLVAHWREKMQLPGDGLRVGLVWGGDPANRSDRNRSCPLPLFAPLAGIPNIRFYSLQVGEAATQLAEPPAGMDLVHLGHEIWDFADTAAILENLDLLISIDTAVVHLAGAMGKPAWVLLSHTPDWRWLLERPDSPWYPGVRLFRQPAYRDWMPVIEAVAAELACFRPGRLSP